MSKTKRDGQWSMTKEQLLEWKKRDKPKTIPSKTVYNRKPKYPAW